ncbi:MAG: l-ornithine N(alpha)-acyltransferase [Alphaproteobacteria bacterium]|jgi:putative hemolysin|tara:strand:+ start:18233 stop:19090 length:858 start_codon:yes stop_codon:yes gene_type:complete
MKETIKTKIAKHIKFKSQDDSEKPNLCVRLSENKNDIRSAQSLRFKVFYKEMSAHPNTLTRVTRRDRDSYDKICSHMLVIDQSSQKRGVPLIGKKRSRVVGTYRLIPQIAAEKNYGFYSQHEYELTHLLKKHKDKKFLELGRSCVLKEYRNKSTIELLWQGVWKYLNDNNIDVMIGCASFQGTDPNDLALPLSFLYHNSLAPDEWLVNAQPDKFVNMNIIKKENINTKQALKALPPLIKGYLRLGAYIGNGAVIDHQFGTTDVFIIMPKKLIEDRFVTRFNAVKS